MLRTPVAAHTARVRALLSAVSQRTVEQVALTRALDRVLAHPVRTPIALPPFRNSQMDGFAVRVTDLARTPRSLPLRGEIPAAPGTPAPLDPGHAVRVMTGAPIPDDADAVVPVEHATVHDATVTFTRKPDAGEFVREAGSDLAAGDPLLPSGLRLAPRHLAALAAAGLDSIPVRSQVRVAVISTGSELATPGEPLAPAQIYDANGPALAAAVRSAGAFLADEHRVVDDTAAFARALDASYAAGAEIVLTSGGISAGSYEVVREFLEPLGAHIDTLAMQPGGPQATALYKDVPVVCFPGNPVSAQLSFMLFIEPILRETAGLPARRPEPRTLAEPLTSVTGKRQFRRGVALPEGRVAPLGGASSHLVAAMAASDVLIDVPIDAVTLDIGTRVETWNL